MSYLTVSMHSTDLWCATRVAHHRISSIKERRGPHLLKLSISRSHRQNEEVFVGGWVDGWMDGWTWTWERIVVEGESVRRVSQMTRIGYLPHHSKSGRFQSPIVVASFTKVQISAVPGSH